MENAKQKQNVACRSKAVVTHIMADGSKRDSIKGYQIPFNEKTQFIYILAAKYMKEQK